ncbi:hypothetical protein DYB37_012838 [Aphanomyces astaci]|uniref:CID domain-containing protein n=1 Tax=Aphanomyces astaci TaxID=112090 RepID=A0A3R7BXF6_APHAT|nr:hypothetical protein DYB35_011270 [Aphanomyces astaci]RHZ06242.1 hypothetical protein DYB37_012838 [Aphanomyces astaci]
MMAGGDESSAAIEIEADVKSVDDGVVDFAVWGRAEIESELAELDDSNERINAVADLFLMHNQDDESHAEDLCALWMANLRDSDTHDRIPFLYVANHVLFKSFKAKSTSFQKALLPLLPEAVSLVSNSPADRDTVLKILRLWYDQTLYPLDAIRVMWKETGEPLPVAWQEKHTRKAEPASEHVEQVNELEPDLPMGLKARAAHPVVDCLKQIDHAKRVVEYLEGLLQAQHKDVMKMATSKYFVTAAEIEAKESPIHLRDRMNHAMQVLHIRNKYMQKLMMLQTKLRETAQAQLVDEVDMMREVETKRMEEEAALRQKEALVANAKIVSLLEEEVAQARAMDVQTALLQQMAEEKDPTKEYVWHPCVFC